MAGPGTDNHDVAVRYTAVTTLLVLLMMALASTTGVVSGGGMHDAVTGSSTVSDRADATLGTGAEQMLSDVGLDRFGRIHVVWQDAREGHKNIMYARSDDLGSSFGPSVLVNDGYGTGDFIDPSVAVDDHGNPFVVWTDPRNSASTGIDIYMARSIDGGDTFGPNVRVVSDVGNRVESSADVAVGRDGRVFVTYVSGTGNSADIYLSVSEDGGRTFGPMRRVNDDGGTVRQLSPVVAVDRSGVAHVAWTDNRNGDLDIYYATRTAQGVLTVNVKVNDDGGGSDQDHPAIALDGSVPMLVWMDRRNSATSGIDIYLARRSSPTRFDANRRVSEDATTENQVSPDIAVAHPSSGGQDPMVHVTWEGVASGEYDIYLANSTDDGISFAEEVQVNSDPTPSAVQHNPSMACLGRDGPLVVTWEDDGRPSRGRDVLASFRTPERVHPQVVVHDDRAKAFEASPATAVGGGGVLNAVWLDNRGGLLDVYHSSSKDDGLTWGSHSRVNDGPAVLHLAPDVAVGPDGTAHVVWVDYRNDGPHVRYANNKGKTSGFNPSVLVDDAPASTLVGSPSVAVASNGSATVAWLDGRDGGTRIRISYSLDGGSSWGPSTEVPGHDGSSIRSAPDIAFRGDLVAVAFIDDVGGSSQVYLSTGPSVPDIGDPLWVEDGPSSTPATGVRVALDPVADGPVHLAWVKGGDVLVSRFSPSERTFSDPQRPVSNTSDGPHAMPSIAVGDGGVLHLGWLDLADPVPVARLVSLVPGLDPPAMARLPAKDGEVAGGPSLAFAAHQLSVVLVENAVADPDVICAVWVNTPPPTPQLQSPVDGGWVTQDDFNLTADPGLDPDGDTVLVRFELVRPGGAVDTRGWDESPRFPITDAAEGTYSWRVMTTDGYSLRMAPVRNFTVDMTPPGTPRLDPLPEFSPGTTCTLEWDPVEDPGGGEVSYRVVASRNEGFTPPHHGDSGWIGGTNHTFEGLPATKIWYKLSARDRAGNLVEAPSTVFSTQDNEVPKVFIRVDPALQAEEGEEVSFDASDSTDDNGIEVYEWDFDSDGEVDSTDAVTTWTYGEAGEFRITIVITDVAGNVARFSDYTLNIVDITPPDIVVVVTPGEEFDEDTTASFDASGTSDPSGVKVIRWFMGTGDVPFATGDSVDVPFPDPGQYQIRVEAVDNHDNRAETSITVTVADITPPRVTFNEMGPLDNTKVDFFTLYVNVSDAGGVASVTLFYKTQEAPTFVEVAMSPSGRYETEWQKDELAPGGKGNATYYVVAADSAGNTNRTSESSDYQRIRVLGVKDPTPSNGNGGDDRVFDIMDQWWTVLLLVIVVAAMALVAGAARRGRGEEARPVEAPGEPAAPVETPPSPPPVAGEQAPARTRALCAIEEVYFIHNDGRLILAASSSTSADRDAQDVFAGMFTAIQDFIKDSMAREGDLGSFDYGDNRIIIERGRTVTCAVTMFGTEPPDLREEVSEVVRHIEGNYAGVIERWDGDKTKLEGINEFAKRILAITGGIDRGTVLRSKERKGVKLLSEVEFFQGFVRLKCAVKNDTDTVVTDTALDVVYDDNVLRLDHIQPVYEYKRGKVYLGNVNSGEKKTVAFNFDPVICMESNIDGTLTYRDVRGKLQVASMKTRRADIVCPIFFTRENANTAMLKRLVREELASQDSKVFRYPDGLAPSQSFELCKGVVHLHDVKFVREFIDEKPAWLGEAWFYGETKVKGYKIVIRVTVREDSHTAEFFTASQEMEVITGLLAEMGHSLNRMLKEKYMGRLKAQPIVDQRLKKELTDQPLLLERET